MQHESQFNFPKHKQVERQCSKDAQIVANTNSTIILSAGGDDDDEQVGEAAKDSHSSVIGAGELVGHNLEERVLFC